MRVSFPILHTRRTTHGREGRSRKTDVVATTTDGDSKPPLPGEQFRHRETSDRVESRNHTTDESRQSVRSLRRRETSMHVDRPVAKHPALPYSRPARQFEESQYPTETGTRESSDRGAIVATCTGPPMSENPTGHIQHHDLPPSGQTATSDCSANCWLNAGSDSA